MNVIMSKGRLENYSNDGSKFRLDFGVEEVVTKDLETWTHRAKTKGTKYVRASALIPCLIYTLRI